MYIGNKIFNHLTTVLHKKERVSSSHWDLYHSDFSFTNGKLKGVKGFGHLNTHYGILSNWIHFFFQRKYIKLSSRSQFFSHLKNSGISIAKVQKRAFGLDILRQVLTLDFLNQNKVLGNIENTLIIGDGFGTLTSIMLMNNLSKTIFLVNLRKTLLVDLLYLKKVIGSERFDKEVVMISTPNDLKKIKSDIRIVAIEAENYDIISQINKDLVINIVSFQEMDMEVINNYLKYIYSQKTPFYFYLCNRENKCLPDGSLISFKNYKFKKNDKVIIDELCPWHQDFYTFRPPFKMKYDGPIRHQIRSIN